MLVVELYGGTRDARSFKFLAVPFNHYAYL